MERVVAREQDRPVRQGQDLVIDAEPRFATARHELAERRHEGARAIDGDAHQACAIRLRDRAVLQRSGHRPVEEHKQRTVSGLGHRGRTGDKLTGSRFSTSRNRRSAGHSAAKACPTTPAPAISSTTRNIGRRRTPTMARSHYADGAAERNHRRRRWASFITRAGQMSVGSRPPSLWALLPRASRGASGRGGGSDEGIPGARSRRDRPIHGPGDARHPPCRPESGRPDPRLPLRSRIDLGRERFRHGVSGWFARDPDVGDGYLPLRRNRLDVEEGSTPRGEMTRRGPRAI